jgi:TPR repeat protein
VEKDVKQAFEWCEKSAEQGFMLAQYNLSMMYAEGMGSRPNEKAAAR